MATILVMNGPNLNLLGTREPTLYGADTLADIEARLRKQTDAAGIDLTFVQSNAEHQLIDTLHAARGKVDFVIINPAALTHTSIGLRDAFSAVAIPFIEVHISNIHAREPFRQHSYLSDIARGVICGLGAQGYELALSAAIKQLNA